MRRVENFRLMEPKSFLPSSLSTPLLHNYYFYQITCPRTLNAMPFVYQALKTRLSIHVFLLILGY